MKVRGFEKNCSKGIRYNFQSNHPRDCIVCLNIVSPSFHYPSSPTFPLAPLPWTGKDDRGQEGVSYIRIQTSSGLHVGSAFLCIIIIFYLSRLVYVPWVFRKFIRFYYDFYWSLWMNCVFKIWYIIRLCRI